MGLAGTLLARKAGMSGDIDGYVHQLEKTRRELRLLGTLWVLMPIAFFSWRGALESVRPSHAVVASACSAAHPYHPSVIFAE